MKSMESRGKKESKINVEGLAVIRQKTFFVGFGSILIKKVCLSYLINYDSMNLQIIISDSNAFF